MTALVCADSEVLTCFGRLLLRLKRRVHARRWRLRVRGGRLTSCVKRRARH